MIGYGHQHIDSDDVEMVTRILRGDTLTCGPMVEAFEAEICKVSGARYAIAVSNGTAALRLMYKAAGIKKGSRVGVPNITFVATASQAMLLGADIVLLDVERGSMLVNPEILEKALRNKWIDYIVPVHMAGHVCDMDGLYRVCNKHKITMLEDAAHAFGSNGSGQCTKSKAAIFSFHPVKNITTGEGGAIVTNDEDFANYCRSLRHHGVVRVNDKSRPWYHEFHEASTNERLSDIQCALGVSQCNKLDAFKNYRRNVVDRYKTELETVKWIRFYPSAIDTFHHLCIAHCDWLRLGHDRLWLFESAKANGIALQVHYIPLSMQKIMCQYEKPNDLTQSLLAYSEIVTLPCSYHMSHQDQTNVINWIKSL